MKTIKFLTVIALCSVILFGCSTKSAMPPHLVAVPKNATLVLSLNAKQIIEKSALNKLEQYQCYSLLQQAFEEKETINKFLKNTRTSGLNLDHIFVYLAIDGSGAKEATPCVGVVFLIDDLNTFEDFLKEIGAYQESESTVLLFNGLNLQWNDEIAVISRYAAESGVDVLNEDKSKSIVSNELFKSEYSDKNDAYLFIDYNNFLTEFLNHAYYANYSAIPGLFASLELYKDLSLAATLNAEKGEFVASGKILPAEKAAELFEKFYKTSFDNDLCRYFPDKSLVAFKLAVKPLDIYNECKKYLDDKDRHVNKIKRFDAKITSILGSFTGDLLGSLSDITSPDFAIAAGITEGKENEVIDWIKELGFVKTKGYYQLNNMGLKLYFASNSEVAYLTGNITNITNFLENSHYASNITDAKDFGKEFEDALCYFYWDLDITHYPPFVKSLLSLANQDAIVPILEKLKSVNIRTVNTNGSEFKIKFTDNEYASRILLKEIDKLAAQSIFGK
jgi:hypothetical protein